MFCNRGWALVVMCLLACGDDDARIAVPPLPDAASMDAGRDDDASVPDCHRDSDCDDGIECTLDRCLPSGRCFSVGDNSRCSDGVYCNGLELCDPSMGCTPGLPLTCNDGEVCTIDRCDEAAKRCTHRPRDFDGDGEADFRCGGGTDCNDYEPTQGSLAAEICGDNIDNDCDDVIDEAECGGPPHDNCEDALDISAGGTFLLALRGARSDYGLSCGSSGQRDLTLRFTLEAASDVALEAQGLWVDGGVESAIVAVRSRCADPQTELTCAGGFPARARMRALPAGDYAVIVSSSVNAQSVRVKLALTPPTTAPTNVDCAAPIALGTGGRVEADFVDVNDSIDVSCGFEGSPDLTYSFDITEPSDVVISSYAPRGERLSISLRSTCEDAASQLRCITGSPAFGRFRGLAPGRYFLVVEGPFAREVDFALDVQLQPPTPEPEGDSCQSPIALPLLTTLDGALTGKQDLIETCGYFYRDAVYRLSISQPTDMRIDVDGGATLMTLAVQAQCDDVDTQLSCVTGDLASSRLRNLQPGDYFVIVEAPMDAAFTITAEPLPLTVPIEVAGNDTCFDAHPVPNEGGLFVGSTLPLIADYKARCGGPSQSNDAVYVVELDQSQRVRVTLDGGYDTVLYRYHSPTIDDGSVCMPFTEVSCNDDVGVSTRSVLDETLAAGTHFFVVSGFGASSSGNYTIEFNTQPL